MQKAAECSQQCRRSTHRRKPPNPKFYNADGQAKQFWQHIQSSTNGNTNTSTELTNSSNFPNFPANTMNSSSSTNAWREKSRKVTPTSKPLHLRVLSRTKQLHPVPQVGTTFCPNLFVGLQVSLNFQIVIPSCLVFRDVVVETQHCGLCEVHCQSGRNKFTTETLTLFSELRLCHHGPPGPLSTCYWLPNVEIVTARKLSMLWYLMTVSHSIRSSTYSRRMGTRSFCRICA